MGEHYGRTEGGELIGPYDSAEELHRELRAANYERRIEQIAEEYGQRALELLRKIAELCKSEGFTIVSEPHDMSADDYRWSMLVQRPDTTDDEGKVDITIEIAETREYGDSETHPTGINFGLDIVEMGGRILGGLTPFNYTEHCWVDALDAEAVEQRWSILQDADISAIPELANERTGV